MKKSFLKDSGIEFENIIKSSSLTSFSSMTKRGVERRRTFRDGKSRAPADRRAAGREREAVEQVVKNCFFRRNLSDFVLAGRI